MIKPGDYVRVVDGPFEGRTGVVLAQYERADARALCATLREQLITSWTLYNYGPTAPIPEIRINVGPPWENIWEVSIGGSDVLIRESRLEVLP